MEIANIVNLHEVLNSTKKLYMVMDLVTGGELFDAVAQEGRLQENASRSYFQQLVDGISYCHSRRVYHRDLKPENLLLSGDKRILKITDFGLASIKAHNAQSELLHTVMGSPHYIAPEVITNAANGYDGAKVDVWASGVILFGMLAGCLPFDEPTTKELYRAIVQNPITFPRHFSYDVIKLLRAMLCKDPGKRVSMEDIKTYAWFKVDYEPAATNGDEDGDVRISSKSSKTEKERQSSSSSKKKPKKVKKQGRQEKGPAAPSASSASESAVSETMSASSTLEDCDRAAPPKPPRKPSGMRDIRQKVVRRISNAKDTKNPAMAAQANATKTSPKSPQGGAFSSSENKPSSPSSKVFGSGTVSADTSSSRLDEVASDPDKDSQAKLAHPVLKADFADRTADTEADRNARQQAKLSRMDGHDGEGHVVPSSIEISSRSLHSDVFDPSKPRRLVSMPSASRSVEAGGLQPSEYLDRTPSRMSDEETDPKLAKSRFPSKLRPRTSSRHGSFSRKESHHSSDGEGTVASVGSTDSGYAFEREAPAWASATPRHRSSVGAGGNREAADLAMDEEEAAANPNDRVVQHDSKSRNLGFKKTSSTRGLSPSFSKGSLGQTKSSGSLRRRLSRSSTHSAKGFRSEDISDANTPAPTKDGKLRVISKSSSVTPSTRLGSGRHATKAPSPAAKGTATDSELSPVSAVDKARADANEKGHDESTTNSGQGTAPDECVNPTEDEASFDPRGSFFKPVKQAFSMLDKTTAVTTTEEIDDVLRDYIDNDLDGDDDWNGTMGVPQHIMESIRKSDHDNGYPPWSALGIDVFEDVDNEDEFDAPPSMTQKERMEYMLARTPSKMPKPAFGSAPIGTAAAGIVSSSLFAPLDNTVVRNLSGEAADNAT